MPSISATTRGLWRVQIYVFGVRESATFRTKREASAWGHQRETKLKEEQGNRRDLAKKLGIRPGTESESEILNNQVPAYNHPGIYILFMGGQAIYVGKSLNVLSRLASHSEKGRKFTHFHVIPCMEEDLDQLELHYINLLSPPENKTI